jgi:hypothetical protein
VSNEPYRPEKELGRANLVTERTFWQDDWDNQEWVEHLQPLMVAVKGGPTKKMKATKKGLISVLTYLHPVFSSYIGFFTN